MSRSPAVAAVDASSSDRILDAAFELLCQRGFAGTAISAVEKQSGLPASSIYHFFGSKRGLCTAVLQRETARWIDRLRASYTPEDDARATLREHLHHVAQMLDERPEFIRLLILLSLEHGSSSPETLELIRSVRRQVSAFLSTVFEQYLEGKREDSAEVAQQLGRMTLAFVEGMLLEASVDPAFKMRVYVDAITTAMDAILVASGNSTLLRSTSSGPAPIPANPVR